MDLEEVRDGFLTSGLPEDVVKELLEAYVEAKRRFHLGDHRPNAVEGGRFSEAAFRLLEHEALGKTTPIGKSLPKVDQLLAQLERAPSAKLSDSIRLHIPRTLRLIYDIRNKRDAAHLADNIDPNLQDASLIVATMDWVMAEFVRLYHSVSPDDAQRIVTELVTKEVPAVQEIDGQPVLLKTLFPRDQALLLLYRAGTERGASLEEVANWLRTERRDNLRNRLRRLDEQGLVFEHPKTGQFHITSKGVSYVEQKRLPQPIEA